MNLESQESQKAERKKDRRGLALRQTGRPSGTSFPSMHLALILTNVIFYGLIKPHGENQTLQRLVCSCATRYNKEDF